MPVPNRSARLATVAIVFVKFMLSGIPAFSIAMSLNWLLVSRAAWPRTAAYAVVLLVQMTINFFLCRRYVFALKSRRGLLRQYLSFVSGNAIIRAFDWALYSVIVAAIPEHYLYVQLGNVVLFSFVKFIFARSIFRVRHLP